MRRKAEKSVEISNGGNFICRKVRGAFQYYLNGEYVKKSEKDKLRLLAKDRYYKKLLPILDAKIEAGRRRLNFSRILNWKMCILRCMKVSKFYLLWILFLLNKEFRCLKMKIMLRKRWMRK